MRGKYTLHPERRGKKGATVALAVLAVLLAAVFVAGWMASRDPEEGRFESVKPDNTVARKVFLASFSGGESSFTAEEINGLLAEALSKYNEGKPVEKRVAALAIAGVSGDCADLYLRVPFHGKRFGVLLSGKPGVESGRLFFRVRSARVGSLPVPAGMLLNAGQSRFPDRFTAEENSIFCDAPGIRASYGGVSGSVTVTGLKIQEGRFVVESRAGLQITG